MIRSIRGMIVLMLAAVIGCGELPTERQTASGPDLKPDRGGGGPSYTLVQGNLPAGYTAARGVAINGRHDVVGTVRGANPLRGFFWAAGSGGGSATPVLLPLPAGSTTSEAYAINDAGVIGGRALLSYETHADYAAVLWVPNGAGWDVEIRAARGSIGGVRNDGTAVGDVWTGYTGFLKDLTAAVWDPSGVLTRLPLPASGQWSMARGDAINAQGDVAGTVIETGPGGISPHYEYGAVWVREGTGWVVLVAQVGSAIGIADRTADGRILAVASGGQQLTVARNPTSGNWELAESPLPGAGFDMNAGGDVAVLIGKGGRVPAGPYLLGASGTLTQLPVPKGKSGVAWGVSADRWLTGEVDAKAALWLPTP